MIFFPVTEWELDMIPLYCNFNPIKINMWQCFNFYLNDIKAAFCINHISRKLYIDEVGVVWFTDKIKILSANHYYLSE